MTTSRVHITDVILRDAHQSLLATRMRTADMLPVCDRLDAIGYWSLEVWGGATFDACLRFLKEDPWERLRQLRDALPNTRLQMLLRGQNLLGYRHYSDDVVRTFVQHAAENGMDVFRIFDALNDTRNLSVAIEAVKAAGRDQVLTQDVVEALQGIGHDESLPDHRRNRAIEMGDGMALFCSGLAGHFFNRPGRLDGPEGQDKKR